MPARPFAAAVLGAESRERGALDIAVHCHGDDHLVPLDQVFIIHARPTQARSADRRGVAKVARISSSSCRITP